MKFAPNRLYIEEYVKCANCGVLIYEDRSTKKLSTVNSGGKLYCSQWCLDWDRARDGSKPAATTPGRSP